MRSLPRISIVLTICASALVLGGGPEPAAAGHGDITTYADPDADVDNPAGIVEGPDGNLWFTISNGIGRIDPDAADPAASIVTFADGNLINPWDITVGPDGNLWFTDVTANLVGRIEPGTGIITTFPDANIVGASDITVGPDDNLWFTIKAGHRIGRVTTSGVITTFPDGALNYPQGITSFGGDLWFTNAGDGKIGKITTTGTVTTYTGTALSTPWDIIGVGDGMVISSYGNNDLSFAIGTGQNASLGPLTANGPGPLAIGPNGDIWFANVDGSSLGRYGLGGSVTTFTDTENEIFMPYGITESGGEMWFTSTGNDRIGRLELDSTAPTVEVTAPTEGGSYVRGSLTVDYDCADEVGGSGVAQCSSAFEDGVPFLDDGPGEYQLSVTATDEAGNTTEEVVNFTITPSGSCNGMPATVELAFGDSVSTGNDVVLGTPAAETIQPIAGNDVVCGGGGNDTVFAAAGNDRVYGQGGVDTIHLAGGNDKGYGGVGNDTINGQAGLDLLEGGTGNDALNGGTQRDTCKGQGGTRDRQTSCEVRSGIP